MLEKQQSSQRAYHWFIRLITPYLFAYTLWRTFQDGDKRYFWQRLGCMYGVDHERPVWFHCASVGEVIAAVPLIHAINRSYPTLAIVITTVTPTGAAIAASRLPDTITHIYLPLDWINATKQFVNAISPRLGIIMETELWPNLYATCRGSSIPLVIVNGRLTEKTLNSQSWLKAAYANALQSVSQVLARSQSDADYFVKLGADESKVQAVGNIKFAPSP